MFVNCSGRSLRACAAYLAKYSTTCLMLALCLVTTSSAFAQNTVSPHLYFFTNDGCAPCKHVEPAVEALKRQGYPVTTVKVSENFGLAQRLQITQTPTLLLFNQKSQIVVRCSKLVGEDDLRRWFAAVGMNRPPASIDRSTTTRPAEASAITRSQRFASPEGTLSTNVTIDRSISNAALAKSVVPESYSTPTMHRGTARPASEAERRAMEATVRLKVEDTGGASFATGTVIHSHGNEALVMTCGHVFREVGERGVITAEYNFYSRPRRARGKLISYDSDARDVALVAIRTSEPIEAVPLADSFASVRPGLDVFSIGCDRGDNPTIRHTKIKNSAEYDNSPKYDIYGRPVMGRSGGGLFTSEGHLIGVCNAAAVEVDEGIYSSLETLRWQVANVGLNHLFDRQNRGLAMTSSSPPRRDTVPEEFNSKNYGRQGGLRRIHPQRTTSQDAGRQFRSSSPTPLDSSPRSTFTANPNRSTTGLPSSREPLEVLITVRSKENPGATQSIRIADPTPELIDYLKKMDLRR